MLTAGECWPNASARSKPADPLSASISSRVFRIITCEIGRSAAVVSCAATPAAALNQRTAGADASSRPPDRINQARRVERLSGDAIMPDMLRDLMGRAANP